MKQLVNIVVFFVYIFDTALITSVISDVWGSST